MKGFEIYSWQENDAWRFSLLIGTNRIKGKDEVTAEVTRLSGLRTLKEALGRLEKGQSVFWPHQRAPGLELPPRAVLSQQAVAADRPGR